jgi:hypothetical protein
MKSALVALTLPFGALLAPMVLTAFRSVKEYLDGTESPGSLQLLSGR